MLRRIFLALSLAFISAAPALADDVGIYFRRPADVASPVVNKTMVVDPDDGALKVYGSLGWVNKTLPQASLEATTAPTINDDADDGYGVGSFWFDSVGGQFYVCTDASVGAAVWALVTSETISPADLENGLKVKLTTADLYGNFKVSGFASSDPGASLAMTTPLGIAYVGGNRLSVGAHANTYTASKDTYDYLQSDGTFLHVAVDNEASAPSGQPGMLLQKVVTDGSEITSVTTLAPSKPTVSVDTATADGHALSLGQANTLYAPIAISTETQTAATVFAAPGGSTGTNANRLLTNSHLPIVDPAKGGMGTAITLNNLGLFYSTGATGGLTGEPGANNIPITNSGPSAWTYISKADLIAEAVAAAVDTIGEGGGGSDESFFGGGATEGSITQNSQTFSNPIITDNSTFEIPTGETVEYESGTAINANSTVTITGTVNVSRAAAGGVGTSDISSCEPGAGFNGGRIGRIVDKASGGGGGGCGNRGGDGGSETSGTIGGLGGAAFRKGTPLLLRGLTGSGGAAGEAGSGAGGDGGEGGGFISINAKSDVLIDGTLDLSGQDGAAGTTQAGGGGGGSGGIAEIHSQTSITISGTVNLSGGDGGDGATSSDGGGGGGAGGILILISPSNSTFGGTINVSGGAAGANGTQAATNGGDGFILEIQAEPNEPLILIHEANLAFYLEEANKERIATGSNVIRWDAAKFQALKKKALTMSKAG